MENKINLSVILPIKTNLVRVPMTDWEIAIFLPTEQFKNVKAQSVWRYSRKQYSS